MFSFEQMHKLAKAAGPYEAMLRALSDCGLRLGELLALERQDLNGDTLTVRQTAHKGRITAGTKTDHGKPAAGRDVPVPPGLLELLRRRPARIDTTLLFPTRSGRPWQARNWYRDVLEPAQERSGVDALPHELRHSWISALRAAGIDPADLAAMSGHTVQTATKHYTHALKRSHQAVREAIG